MNAMLKVRWANVLCLLLLALPWTGCTSPLFRAQSPENEGFAEVDEGPQLIGDVASPWGTQWVKVESVGLVTLLDKTGSDPPPGTLRATLTREMQTHDVSKIKDVLESNNTSLVMVKGYLRPGIQEGDRFDIQVRVPVGSKTTTLQGGWLMRSRLREMAVLENELHSGDVLGLAEGQVVIDSLFQGKDDKIHQKRGRILGGAVALKSRPLGLVVRKGSSSILTAKRIGAAINARFHSYSQGSKSGVATPKRDNFVELRVHPRYRHNIARYVRVIRNIAIRESSTERADRMQLLVHMLLEPTTAANAALQLEGIGQQGLETLRQGLLSPDVEVRFYAAEALAYQDEEDAVPVLAEAARDEPALRWHALTALSTMDHVTAYDALVDLLHVASAETRYGAFRALRERNPRDPLVRGEVLGDGEFRYHLINTPGESMVHFSRTRQPEVILFGHDQTVVPPAFLYAGKEILIKGLDDNRIKVSRFAAGEDNDQQRICSPKLDEIVRAIVAVGGGYEEVMQAIHNAKQSSYLVARVAFEARPRANRVYRREEGTGAEPIAQLQARTPTPELFDEQRDSDDSKEPLREREAGFGDQRAQRGFFGRMADWFSWSAAAE